MAPSTTEGALLRVDRVRKVFGRVTALDGVDFDLREREVVALVGDNGAGKSTLVKVLSGFFQPDEGEVRLRGVALQLRSPADARAQGIETVYQDLALAGPMSIESNMFLGREWRQSGLRRKAPTASRCRQYASGDLSPDGGTEHFRAADSIGRDALWRPATSDCDRESCQLGQRDRDSRRANRSARGQTGGAGS